MPVMLFIIGGVVMAAAVSVLVIRGSKRKNRNEGGLVLTATTVSPPLVSNVVSLFAPTIDAAGLILAPLLSNEQTFYSPSVSPEDAILPGLLTNSQTFFAPALKLNVIPLLISNDNTFYGPQVVAAGVLAAPLLVNTTTIYSPAVVLNMTLPLVTATGQIYAPAVFGEEAIYPPLVTSSQTFFQPQLKQNITAPKLTNANGFFPFSVSQPNFPGFALSTPTATVTSSAGAALEVSVAMGADIWAGYKLRIQRSLSSTKNVSDGSYASPTLNVVHFVTDSEVAAEAITVADTALDGYTDPTGAGFQQYRWERDDGAISNWSEISYNVTASVAKLNPNTGVSKSQYLTLSNGNLTGAGQDLGAPCSSRATLPATGKKHFEITVDALKASAGRLLIGVTDANLALGPNVFPVPGNGTTSGCSLRISVAGSGEIWRNGTFQNGSEGAWVSGDKAIVEFDTATNQVTFKKYRSGVTTNIGTVTLTSNIPAQWYAFAGTYFSGDQFTANFGASAFSVSPSSGYSFYA